MTGEARHKADEIHLTRFGITGLLRHLRNRLHSGHSFGHKELSYMSKEDLVKLHQKLHMPKE